MDIPVTPQAPEPSEPTADLDENRFALWRSVQETLFALPIYFSSSLNLDGIIATDIFTFNSSLGATIEQQVVDSLNRLRSTWDPLRRYDDYAFERQPQRFPDVILRSNRPGDGSVPIMGIELKGWYALAKEGEPSFRYAVTPAVCTEYDLLVVFPWALSNVISGSPFLLPPHVVGARYAAAYRNWHWEFVRNVVGDGQRGVRLATASTPYPRKSDPISDAALEDRGGNFGRYARTGLMDDFIDDMKQRLLSGVPIDAWRRFFQVFTEGDSSERLEVVIRQLERRRREAGEAGITLQELEDFRSAIAVIAEQLS